MNRMVELLGVLVIGIVVGDAAVWVSGVFKNPQIQILEGYTTVVDETGTAIGLAADESGAGYLGGYHVAGA